MCSSENIYIHVCMCMFMKHEDLNTCNQIMPVCLFIICVLCVKEDKCLKNQLYHLSVYPDSIGQKFWWLHCEYHLYTIKGSVLQEN